jgi:hypothetical protein
LPFDDAGYFDDMTLKYLIKRNIASIFSLLQSTILTTEWEMLKRKGVVVCGRHTYGVPAVNTFAATNLAGLKWGILHPLPIR